MQSRVAKSLSRALAAAAAVTCQDTRSREADDSNIKVKLKLKDGPSTNPMIETFLIGKVKVRTNF